MLFKRNLDAFLRQFITVDETWNPHKTPKTNQQSEQWVTPVQIGAKEVQSRYVSQQSHVDLFCGCTRYTLHRLPSIEMSKQWQKLCHLIDPVQG